MTPRYLQSARPIRFWLCVLCLFFLGAWRCPIAKAERLYERDEKDTFLRIERITAEAASALVQPVDYITIETRHGKAVVPALAELLKDNDKFVRLAAVDALLGYGAPEAKAAIPDLVRLLKDDDWGFRSSAAIALGRIGPEARAAIPALTELLTDKDARVPQAAAEALQKIKAEKK
jgi:HEAT repeat protein